MRRWWAVIAVAAVALAGVSTLAAPAMAQGAEINVFTPAVVWNAGLQDIAADYTKKTGVKVTIKNLNMGKIVGEIRTGTPVADPASWSW